mmetsp:Transcript_28907/g.78318  ORF Transcript_28907/g.78318 Transcript_28907/m.78318 type:complete len:94 (-) Transcript_28907:1544-1825(-)
MPSQIQWRMDTPFQMQKWGTTSKVQFASIEKTPQFKNDDDLTSFHPSSFKINFSVATTFATEKMLSQQKEMSFSVRKTLLHLEAIEMQAPATS